MKALAIACVSIGVAAGVLPCQLDALEQQVDDLPASVEIRPVFRFSLDNPNIAFGSLSSGSTSVLGSGHFFNEVRCRSNAGRSWYLKAQLLSLKHLDTNEPLAPSHLQWKIVESTGAGEPTGGRQAFHPFAEEPVLLYASQGDDQRGNEVVLRFQYSLTTPPEARAGNYVGQIIFTMAESP